MVSLVCLTAVLAALLANISDAFAPQPVLPQSQRDSSGKLSMFSVCLFSAMDKRLNEMLGKIYRNAT